MDVSYSINYFAEYYCSILFQIVIICQIVYLKYVVVACLVRLEVPGQGRGSSRHRILTWTSVRQIFQIDEQASYMYPDH